MSTPTPHWVRFRPRPKTVTQLMDRLRFKIQPKHRKFAQKGGPEKGRLLMLRQTVTALLKHERLELNYHRADETRGYAERVRFCAETYPPTSYSLSPSIIISANFGCDSIWRPAQAYHGNG